jgi:uroporphyrinogen decarboxylase
VTGLERVLGTLGGKALDRRVVAPVLGLYAAGLTRTPLAEHYTDPVAFARGQLAVHETFAPDVLFAPFTFAGIGEAFGSEVRYFEDQPPNVRRPAVDSASGWDTLTLPDPDGHPRLLFLRRAVERLAAGLAGEAPVAAPLPSPVDLPALVLGLEGWLEAVLFEPGRARAILEDSTELFVRLANGLLQAGAALIVVPSGLTAPRMVPREVVAGFSVPALASALARLSGPVLLHHVGAPMLATLDLVAGLPNVVGFALDESDDPALARRIVGRDKVLFTGPGGLALGGLGAAEVEGRCLARLEAARADPRLALFTAGADVPLATPPDRIHALRRAAERAGWGAAA